MTTYAYLFEAKSIQTYILDSGKMRHLIGASELVDSLTGTLLDDALVALSYDESQIQFSRRAGGALYAFTENQEGRDRFGQLWSLLIAQYAPGLACDTGYGSGSNASTAFSDARDALRKDNAKVRPSLPITAPIAERSRRTGLPGVSHQKDLDTRQKVAIDLPSLRKHQFNQAIKDDEVQSGLIERFSPEEENLSWGDWPRDLTPGADGAFPFNGDDHTVALIHADGNGMGELLRRAGEKASGQEGKFIRIFRELSETITDITQTAARHATSEVLIQDRDERLKRNPKNSSMLAARPIVLGGDDLTILVRADLALPFARAFLEKFENESAERLPELDIGASGITAGAGIVYLRASQPFYLASAMAESLAKLAKDQAKQKDTIHPPSTLAFHRVTQSMLESYEDILRKEKTLNINDQEYINTLGAYALKSGQHIPALDDLLGLQALLGSEHMSRGPTRQLQTLVGLAPGQAEIAYKRWHTLMKDKQPKLRDNFNISMQTLMPNYNLDSKLPYAQAPDPNPKQTRHSPLGDVLTLMAVKNQPPTETTSNKEVA